MGIPKNVYTTIVMEWIYQTKTFLQSFHMLATIFRNLGKHRKLWEIIY